MWWPLMENHELWLLTLAVWAALFLGSLLLLFGHYWTGFVGYHFGDGAIAQDRPTAPPPVRPLLVLLLLLAALIIAGETMGFVRLVWWLVTKDTGSPGG